MAKLLGLDVGYGFVKVTDGESGYVFPSVVGDVDEGQFLYPAIQPKDPLGALRFGIDGREFLVGKAAIRHSNLAFRALSTTRSEGGDLKALFLSAVGLFCGGSAREFDVVTGLPPGCMHLAEGMVDQVRGNHRVRAWRGGAAEDMEVLVRSVEVVPQPLGTYWSQALEAPASEDGAVEGRVGILDIGFVTTDLAAVEDGEFIPARSGTVRVGLANAYLDIANRLFRQYGLERETYGLDSAVIKGRVTVSGRTVDIAPMCAQVFERLATKVLVELASTWQVEAFDTILLSGGGSQLLSQYLLPHIPNARLVDDPITANCRGYWAWGRQQARVEGLVS